MCKSACLVIDMKVPVSTHAYLNTITHRRLLVSYSSCAILLLLQYNAQNSGRKLLQSTWGDKEVRARAQAVFQSTLNKVFSLMLLLLHVDCSSCFLLRGARCVMLTGGRVKKGFFFRKLCFRHLARGFPESRISQETVPSFLFT